MTIRVGAVQAEPAWVNLLGGADETIALTKKLLTRASMSLVSGTLGEMSVRSCDRASLPGKTLIGAKGHLDGKRPHQCRAGS